MNYYFFVSSLPSLSLQDAPPLSLDNFAALCAEHLTKGDFKAVLALINDTPEHSDNGFVRSWTRKETMLRNAITKIRAARLRKDPAGHLREQADYDSYFEKAASDAFSKSTPVERELALDRFRWQQIEELEGYTFASSRAVFGYTLKLRMAERWANVDADKGSRKAAELIAREPGEEKDTAAEPRTE
jgi:hypothetical protein